MTTPVRARAPANLAQIVSDALDEGSRYIFHRDDGEDDITRELARLVARRHATDRVMMITGSLVEMIETEHLVRTFLPGSAVGRIQDWHPEGRRPSVAIGILRHVLRQAKRETVASGLVILLPSVPHPDKAAILDTVKATAILDVAGRTATPLRKADRVVFRPTGGHLQTLHAMTPVSSRYLQ